MNYEISSHLEQAFPPKLHSSIESMCSKRVTMTYTAQFTW